MALLSEIIKIDWVEAYAAAGTSTLVSHSVDMQDYNGVLFVAKFGTAAADNTLSAQQSSDDAVADAFTDILGTSVGVGASDEVVWLEISHPTERYITCSALRGTSTTLEGIVAFRYGARELPVDNTVAGTIHGEAHVAAAEGTA